MLRDVGIVITFDFIVMLAMIGFLYPRSALVYNSSRKLFYVGAGFVLFEAFFVIRNTVLIALCLCSPNPNRRALFGRVGLTCVDLTFLTSFLIWATTVTFSDGLKLFKEEST